MTLQEAANVYKRMKVLRNFDEIHLKRARGEITDLEFLKLLDTIQIRAEETMLRVPEIEPEASSE